MAKTGLHVPRGPGAVEIFENPEDLIEEKQKTLVEEVAELKKTMALLVQRIAALEKHEVTKNGRDV